VRLNGALRQENLDGAAPTPPNFGIALKGEVLTSTAFDKSRSRRPLNPARVRAALKSRRYAQRRFVYKERGHPTRSSINLITFSMQ
jgi:hypothetical protein